MSHISRIKINDLPTIKKSRQTSEFSQPIAPVFPQSSSSHIHPCNQIDEILDRISSKNDPQARLLSEKQDILAHKGWLKSQYINLIGLNFQDHLKTPRDIAVNLTRLQSKAEYLNTAREQLLRERKSKLPNPLPSGSFDKVGYRDEFGYVIRFEEGVPTAPGEATYDTAIAIVALATGNYNQDSWEVDTANAAIEELLDVLLEKSWGNRDGLRRVHPIRHPNHFDYDSTKNKLRNRPLSKDSFGQIIAAAYYVYQCPNSSSKVREKARALIQKWTNYLVLNQWRLHSNYISGEFEQDGDKFKNIFDKNGEPEGYIGLETFLLVPHEIYALQNVASRLGIPTSGWNIEPIWDLFRFSGGAATLAERDR